MLAADKMDTPFRILRVFDEVPVKSKPRSSDEQEVAALTDCALSEIVAVPSSSAALRGGWGALASQLNALASKYMQFHRSIAPCALVSCSGCAPHAADSSRSLSEGAKAAGAAERANRGGPLKHTAAASTSSSTSVCSPPDLESFWVATAPLPPTAVLAALYSLLPLRHVSVLDDAVKSSGAAEGGARNGSGGAAPTQAPLASCEFIWTLCRSRELPGRKDTLQVSYWEAFAMTAVAAHRATNAAVESVHGGSAFSSSSSASSLSLAHQLRRASETLNRSHQSDPAAAPARTSAGVLAAALLEWPEELVWNLLVSLLSVLALVHSAGLHFHGELTASDVLCLSCASSLPRLLEQTWQDVLAATPSGNAETATVDNVALFRHFYSMAASSVLLPQASLTATTPCHNAFFVVQPSLALLSRHQREGGIAGDHQSLDSAVVVSAAAQGAAAETPEQQARFQAADLASAGRLLTSIIDVRAQWSREREVSLSSHDSAAPSGSAAHASSELVFLVHRLCECEPAATAPPIARSCPSALQLLQLQALRLRTETWYYRRLAAEAFDRLAQLPPKYPAPGRADCVPAPEFTDEEGPYIAAKQRERERALQTREAAVTEREAKLNLILQVYELTHEHLDPVNVPTIQSLPPSADGRVSRSGPQSAGSPPRSSTPRDDSLEALLGAPLYRQAANTTAAPMPRSRVVPTTNVFHQLRRDEELADEAAEVSGDALLGLSPLKRESLAGDADATLLSAGATPLASLRYVDTAAAATAKATTPASPLLWSAPSPHGVLDVGGPVHSVSSDIRKKEEEGERGVPDPQTTWPAPRARPPAQGALGAMDGKASSEDLRLTNTVYFKPTSSPNAPVYTLQDHPHQHLQQQMQHHRQPLYSPELRATHEDPCHVGANEQVTVVEVELDDSDDVDGQATWGSDDRSRGAAHGWLPERAEQEVRQTSNPTDSASQLVASSHAYSPPQKFFSSFPFSGVSGAQELRTPVRAPALPNMGVAEADIGGVNAVGGSHSKYSSLALLRTPPSARRPGTGSAKSNTSPSPSPHSPESYRSSTKPYATTAISGGAAAESGHTGGSQTTQAAVAAAAAAQAYPRPRSSRRRSGSRGSSRTHPDQHNNISASCGVYSTTPSAAAAGATNENENATWARQQLDELQNMQTALRAQQPATPRNRASTSAASAVAAAAEGGTPERRPMRSPGTSPPPRPSREALMTPPSPSSLQATPRRDGVRADRSPAETDSSHRTRSLHPQDNLFSLQGPSQRGEWPAQVRGASWSTSGGPGAPLSGRARREDGWSTPSAANAPAASRQALLLSGRRTPPTKATNPSARLASGAPALATAGASLGVDANGRARADFASSSSRPASARANVHATSATAAALGAALRTPPRPSASAGAAMDVSPDLRRPATALHPSHVALPSPSAAGSSAQTQGVNRKSDVAAAAVSHQPFATHRLSVQGEGSAAPTHSVSRPGAPATTAAVVSSRKAESDATPRPSNGRSSGPVMRTRGPVDSSGEAAQASRSSASARRDRKVENISSSLPPSVSAAPAATPLGGRPVAGVRTGSSISAVELLKRLRASSAAAV